MDFILPICSTAQVEKDANESISPKLTQWAGNIPLKFEKWDVVVVPGKDEAEWWAGAPSVVRDDGTWWRRRTARMRYVCIVCLDESIAFTNTRFAFPLSQVRYSNLSEHLI